MMKLHTTDTNNSKNMAQNQPLILNIVTQMEAGGAQKAALQICEKLMEKGFRSEVWFLYKKRPTYESLPYVWWICSNRPDKPGDIFRLLYTLRKWIIEAAPIAIITYTHYANVIGQLVAWSVGIPYRLATQRNPSWSYPLGARWCDRLCGTLGIYTANIYVSESVKKSFASYPLPYRRRSRVVVNGLAKPCPSVTKAEARQKLGFPQEAVIIVNVGRLSYQKNQEMLVKAIARIPDNKVILAIAGDGELRAQIHTLIARNDLTHRVVLLGELLPSQIPDFLVAGDIFAFPSRYEAFGFALVEAMMLGLPVLVSDIDAHREVVGDAGIFLPVDNIEAWTQAVISLVEDPLLRTEMAARAQERAKAYDLDRMIDGYLRALFGEGPDALYSARRRS